MAEIIKYGASDVKAHIAHDLRDLPEGKDYGNESVDPTLSKNNTHLISRGTNAAEVNKYRKELEKEIFKYNRKNLVHGVEVVVQCPDDCPEEQKEDFFRETYNFICSQLPMGERCVFVAEVHTDEHKYVEKKDGTIIDISHNHLHVMYTPAVKDTKHEGYEYKLCADELTKRARLKEFHPKLQKHLDDCGIHATVIHKQEGDGKSIALSVKQLKEITNKTGIVIDKSITVEQLAEILQENRDIKLYDKELKAKFDIELKKNLSHTEEQLQHKDAEYQQLKAKASKIISAKNAEIEATNQKVSSKDVEISELKRNNKELEQRVEALEEALKQKEMELEQTKEKAHEREVEASSKEWGSDNVWGTQNSWGRSTHIEEEKTW